jgi:purine-nucleoside phosphorylase
MELFRTRVEEAADFIGSRLETRPGVAIVLGTGLGAVADAMEPSAAIPYGTIPHFPVSTAPSHHGRLLHGAWAGKSILAMQGRFHLYEGYTPLQIAFPIRVLAALGVKTLILSSAAGGLDPRFRPGDLMLLRDHINLTGQNPLVGPNVDEWGPRFPDMTQPYSLRLRELALETAVSERIPLHQGVFAGVLGPSLETAAETRFLRQIGADAVGMSVVMEAVAAVHAGLELLGISVVSNVNLPDCYEPAPIEQIIATVDAAGPKFVRLLASILARL